MATSSEDTYASGNSRFEKAKEMKKTQDGLGRLTSNSVVTERTCDESMSDGSEQKDTQDIRERVNPFFVATSYTPITDQEVELSYSIEFNVAI